MLRLVGRRSGHDARLSRRAPRRPWAPEARIGEWSHPVPSTTNALAIHSHTRGTQGRALRRKACRGGWGSPPRGREGRGARALSLRGPTASARALRYPTQHPASGSCSSATEAALLASGSSANALRFPCDLLCRASVRRCKEGERERHKKLSYTPRNDGLLDNLYFLTPEVNGL